MQQKNNKIQRQGDENMSEERKENIQTGNPLGEASVVSLMVKFAVPSIIGNACQCLI